MVHVPENSQNTLVPYSAYNSPIHTKSDDSFVTILTNSELHYATSHTPSHPLPLHTRSKPSAKANTLPTQLLRSVGYTHSDSLVYGRASGVGSAGLGVSRRIVLSYKDWFVILHYLYS
jgi:hypothetical protein